MPHNLQATAWHPPGAAALLRWPLPWQGLGNRLLMRTLALLARRHVLSIRGLEHIAPAHDPFIVVLNHSTRTEAILVPALLMLHRGGRLIHFLADWNYRLIPGIGLLYRRAETVTVTRKPARPRLFNAFKRFYLHRLTALERARNCMLRGDSVGIFPEGAINRSPHRLLPGRRGAARLSLETGAAVVPVGIRFPHLAPGQLIGDHALMEIIIGAPLRPPSLNKTLPMEGWAPLSDVRAWHAVIMGRIATLSGKSWHPPIRASLPREDRHAA